MFDRNRLDPLSQNDLVGESPTDFRAAVNAQRASLMLREMRLRAGLSVEELADRLHRTVGEVDKIERGQLLESPTMSLMFEVADICGAKVAVRIKRQVLAV
jgi:DNA-binding transcriptional regulator YiaG